MLAKPCSSKVRESDAITSRSTARAAGSSSGNPLSGVGLLMWEVLSQVLEEGVRGALAADRGLLAVPGQHHDVVGQRQHLALEALQHGRMVAAGQVGAP